MLREMSSGRGEGPSYMKVPYTDPPFGVISSHNCTDFGVGAILDQEGGTKMHSFASVYLLICLY